jgi:O-antigen/teichoic acid export membrane protein
VSIMPLLNTFFLSAGMGLAFTGIYAIANYIATVVEVPNRSLNAIVQPEISESVKSNNMDHAEQLCKSVALHLMLSSSIIFFFIWINLDVLFQILPNGDDYVGGKSVVLILGITKVIGSTLFVGSSLLNYSKYYYWTLIFTLLLTTSAIGLNVLLIPTLGMDGAALSQLISYTAYYIFLLAIVRGKLKVSIFSKPQLKVIALIAFLFLLNFGWQQLLCPLFLQLPVSEKTALITDAVVRSVVLMAIAVVICYYWKISEEINRLIRKTLHIKG